MSAIPLARRELKPRVVREVITPDRARQFLAHMVNNRPRSDAKTLEYALAIDQGRWSENGETIKFNGRGEMFDGQHRCEAGILAGKPFVSWVAYDIDDPRAFATVDVGKTRSRTDVLGLAGVANQANVGAAATLIMLFERKQLGWSGATNSRFERGDGDVASRVKSLPKRTSVLSKDQIVEWVLANNDDLQTAVRHGGGAAARRFVPAATLTACYYLFAKKSVTEADRFIQDLSEGVGLGARDPVWVLRERLLNPSGGTKFTRWVTFGFCLKAWNKRREGAQLHSMRVVEGEAFPLKLL